MAIAFDNAAATYADESGSERTLSFTVGNGDDRILIVGFRTGNRTVTSVTYNGASLTELFGISTGQYFGYLLNPDSGTNNLVVNLSGTSNGEYMAAVSLSGVSGVGALYNSNLNGANLSNNITPTSSSSWLVDCIAINLTNLGTVGTGQTQRCVNNEQFVSPSIAMSTKPNSSTSQTSMSWSSGSTVYLHGIVEVIDANPPVLGTSKFFQLF